MSFQISEFDKAHVYSIIVNRDNQWNSFSNMLLRLIAKADTDNRNLLAIIYPTHVDAYRDWFEGKH